MKRQMTRIEANLSVLAQLHEALANLPDSLWTKLVPGSRGLRIGSQVRHVIECYECFLNGLPFRRIDYDSRTRNTTVENSRLVALRALRSVDRRLSLNSELEDALSVTVRDDEAEMPSTAGRELGSLMNHTIHHMALIAIAITAFGIPLDPSFGVAPATLRYRERTAGAVA